MCNASTLLDCLLASFLPTEDEEGEEALEAEGDGGAEQASETQQSVMHWRMVVGRFCGRLLDHLCTK